MSTTRPRPSPATVALLAAVLLVLAAPAALAMGEGDSTRSTTTVTKPVPTCQQKGFVWDDKEKKCVRQQKGKQSDQSLIEQGWTLARFGHYELAIDLFMLVADRADPRVLNGLGYANRKLGDLETGIAYYRQAIALAPDYLLAREYLGEGYLAAGRIDLARVELAEIEKRCGTLCEPYQELAAAIARGEAAGQ